MDATHVNELPDELGHRTALQVPQTPGTLCPTTAVAQTAVQAHSWALQTPICVMLLLRYLRCSRQRPMQQGTLLEVEGYKL